MSQISQFLIAIDGGIGHYCPACRDVHVLHTDIPNINGGIWHWNGDLVVPTLTPSVTIVSRRANKIIDRCHYTLIKGELKFLSDCTHHLKGITMRLPPIPMHLRRSCF